MTYFLKQKLIGIQKSDLKPKRMEVEVLKLFPESSLTTVQVTCFYFSCLDSALSCTKPILTCVSARIPSESWDAAVPLETRGVELRDQEFNGIATKESN